MSRIQHVYRRGAVYWFRRKFILSDSSVHHITLSLGISRPALARQLAAALACEVGNVQAMLEQAIQEKPRPSRSELRAMAKQTFEQVRDWFILVQLEQPKRSGEFLAESQASAFLCERMIAGHRPSMHDGTFMAAVDAQLSKEALGKLGSFLLGEQNPIAESRITRLLKQFKIENSPSNRNAVYRSLLPAMRDACLVAANDLQFPANYLDGEELGSLPAGENLPVDPTCQNDRENVSHPPPSPRLSEMFEECRAENVKNGTWRQNSGEEARRTISLFTKVNGDLHISEIEQRHLVELVRTFNELPKIYGRTKSEKAGGLEASRELAKKLPAEKVGFSLATKRKHLTWLSAVLKFAKGRGYKPAGELDFESLRKGKKTVRDCELTEPWTSDELRRLFSAPVWTGSADLWNRLEPGAEIYHDAWYFAPIFVATYGHRSSEGFGLLLSEVHEDHLIPQFEIAPNEVRLLKTLQSKRKLPISRELIRLGFLEYVREMKRLGHKYLFPELISPNNKSGPASSFYKVVFAKWRQWAFPDGCWYTRSDGVRCQKDVKSFRSATPSIMKGKVDDGIRNDIAGRSGGNVGLETYESFAELNITLDALDHLAFVTEQIQAVPLNLRPTE